MINICQLYYLFIPAVVVFATLSIMFFVYSKPVIV
jgi:ATP-binding cassette subfamily C (CFTR/MRP) protein 4